MHRFRKWKVWQKSRRENCLAWLDCSLRRMFSVKDFHVADEVENVHFTKSRYEGTGGGGWRCSLYMNSMAMGRMNIMEKLM